MTQEYVNIWLMTTDVQYLSISVSWHHTHSTSIHPFHASRNLLVLFYKAIIESIITSSFTVWYGSSDSRTKRKLERVVTKASNITGCDLPSIHSLYLERSLNRANKIIRDTSHPSHDLFQLRPSGRRYRSLKTGMTSFNNSRDGNREPVLVQNRFRVNRFLGIISKPA
jgi:hypothetical protein